MNSHFRIHLDELASSISNHPILKSLPLTSDLLRRYNHAIAVLSQYTSDITQVWSHQNLWVIENCLQRALLKIDDEGNIKANLESRILLILREADCLAKLRLEMPVVATAMLSRKDQFFVIKDSLQLVLDEFAETARRVKQEVRPLVIPHLMRLTSLFKPALTTLTWIKSDWKEFCKNAREQIKCFGVLITRVHDVYINR